MFPGGLNSTYSDYAKNLYALLTGRVTSFGQTYVLMPDGTFKASGETIGHAVKDTYAGYINDTWRVKPNLTLTLGVRYQLEMPITTEGFYTVPAELGDGLWHHRRERERYLRVGQSLQARHDDRVRTTSTSSNTSPAVRRTRPTTTTSCRARRRPGARPSTPRWSRGSSAPSRCSAAATRCRSTRSARTSSPDNYGGNIGRTRTGTRNATSGTPTHGLRWLAGPPARSVQALPVGPAGAARRRLRAHAGRQRVDRHSLPGLGNAARAPVPASASSASSAATSASMSATSATPASARGRHLANMNAHRPVVDHRERLLRRVPEGAGQPPREHRRGTRQHLRLHGRAGHVAAPDLHGLLPGHSAR